MRVWLLYDALDRIEGVYSESGKEAREEQFYKEALVNRKHRNSILAQEVEELKTMRKPYFDEAERLLEVEREAKEINHTVKLQEARKQRKVALRQADKLTYEINRRETDIYNSELLMKKDIISFYGTYHLWDEQYVLEA